MKGDDAFCWSWKAVMRKFSRCRVISISEQVARRCNDEENRGKFCKDINYFIAVKEGGTFKLEILQERGAVTRWYNWQNCKKEDILRTAAKVVFLCTQVFSSLVEDQHFGGFSSKGFKRRLGYIFIGPKSYYHCNVTQSVTWGRFPEKNCCSFGFCPNNPPSFPQFVQLVPLFLNAKNVNLSDIQNDLLS